MSSSWKGIEEFSLNLWKGNYLSKRSYLWQSSTICWKMLFGLKSQKQLKGKDTLLTQGIEKQIMRKWQLLRKDLTKVCKEKAQLKVLMILLLNQDKRQILLEVPNQLPLSFLQYLLLLSNKYL